MAVSGKEAAAVEVAADFARGKKCDADVEAGESLYGTGSQQTLHLLRGLHLAGQCGTLLGTLTLIAEGETKRRGENAGGCDAAGFEREPSPGGEDIGTPGI